MYKKQGITLTPELLKACQEMHGFNLTPGTSGVSASNPEETKEKYYPLLKGIFPFSWSYCMLIALYPNRNIPGHKDPFKFSTRYHIPLLTNEHCWVFHDGTWEQLEAGTLYTMDPLLFHGAVNWGDSLRVHLIIDA